MHINFLFLNQKLSIKYRGDLSQALDYLLFEYGIVRIHSIRLKKGPLIIFRDLPGVVKVKNWAIKREQHI